MNGTAVKLFFLLLTAFVSFANPSGEIDDSNCLKNLSDYLTYAAMNNPHLKAEFQNWKAAVEQIPQEKSLDDPKFTYSYFIQEVETRVGPQQNKFSIMQTFPWFGEIKARTDAASAKAKAAYQKYESARLNLFWKVKDAYYEFSYLATAIEIAKNNLELLTHFEQVARTKYRTSKVTHPDIIRAQIELAKLEDTLSSLKEIKEPTMARLNSILNRPAGKQLDWPDKPALLKPELVRKDIIAGIINNNPELSQLNWQARAARAEVELAKKNFYPDIAVGVDWIQTGSSANTTVNDSGKDAVALMFSVNIPLWQESYKAAHRQAKANVRKYRQEKIDLQNKKIFDALRVIYEIEDSKRKLQLYTNVLVPKARELIKSSEAAYRSGTVDFLSLIDAQRIMLRYQLDYQRAVTDNLQSIAELEAMIGKQLY